MKPWIIATAFVAPGLALASLVAWQVYKPGPEQAPAASAPVITQAPPPNPSVTPSTDPTVISKYHLVAIDSWGPVKIGMTRGEAESALGGPEGLRVPDPFEPDQECNYGYPAMGPEGVAFMLINDVIARIDIENPAVLTSLGVFIGSEESEVLALYPGNVATQPHKYEDGHYLIVTDPAKAGLAYVFETDGTKVTRYRVGRQPEVEWVEGCS